MNNRLLLLGIAVLLLSIGLSGCQTSGEYDAEIEARLYIKDKYDTDKVETKKVYTLDDNKWRIELRVYWGGMWRAESVIVEKTDGHYTCREPSSDIVSPDKSYPSKENSDDDEFLPMLLDDVKIANGYMMEIIQLFENTSTAQCRRVADDLHDEWGFGYDYEYSYYYITKNATELKDKFVSFCGKTYTLYLDIDGYHKYRFREGYEELEQHYYDKFYGDYNSMNSTLNQVINGLEKEGYTIS